MGDVATITCEMEPDCLLSYDAHFQFQVLLIATSYHRDLLVCYFRGLVNYYVTSLPRGNVIGKKHLCCMRLVGIDGYEGHIYVSVE